jgi:hypothetical protein
MSRKGERQVPRCSSAGLSFGRGVSILFPFLVTLTVTLAGTALHLDLPRGLCGGESLPASRRISPHDLQTVRCPRHEPSRDYIALELWELRYPSLVERRLSDVVEHSCTEQLY